MGINKDKFDETEPIGHKYELEVLELCKRVDPKSFKKDGYFKPYDIMMPTKGVTLEVKQDLTSDKTGNLYIEAEQDGEASGIRATTSDLWVQCDEEYHYVFLTKHLKAYCKRKLPKEFRGEDGTEQLAYLIKKTDLREVPLLLRKTRT